MSKQYVVYKLLSSCLLMLFQLHQILHKFYFWPITLESRLEQEGIYVMPCENSRAEMCRENNGQPAARFVCIAEHLLCRLTWSECAPVRQQYKQCQGRLACTISMCTVAHFRILALAFRHCIHTFTNSFQCEHLEPVPWF